MSVRHCVVAALTVVVACSPPPGARPVPVPAERDVLTSEELTTAGGTTQNAYSAVERLRPLFLTIRPGSGTIRDTAPRLYVFINGSLAGDIDVLRTIPLASVESIRRVQASAASTELGEIHAGDGVILVRLRR